MEIRSLIESCQTKSPCEMEIRYNEPMSEHCTFKAGGPADCWIRPSGEGFPAFFTTLITGLGLSNKNYKPRRTRRNTEEEAEIQAKLRDLRVLRGKTLTSWTSPDGHTPVFFLGGGANILVADAGIRGIVIDTSGWEGETGHRQKEGILEFRAGTSLDSAAEIAADAGLSGLEFLAGMPGSIGGAVWMNARCYGREIADALLETEIIDFSSEKPEPQRLPAHKSEFGYKLSPFQNRDVLILSAAFQLTPGDKEKIRTEMAAHRADREAKGHYRHPSAGSVFKNNPAFGKPSGQIIDELGLCGLCKGGAQVAPWHGNFIINTGGASASDIRALIEEVAAQVKAKTGFVLETEVLFVGNWDN